MSEDKYDLEISIIANCCKELNKLDEKEAKKRVIRALMALINMDTAQPCPSPGPITPIYSAPIIED